MMFSVHNLLFIIIIASLGSVRPPTYFCHSLVLFNRDKFVMHAMHQQDGHCQLSVVDLVPLRPVLPTHHGTQHKRRHIEGIVLFQQLLLPGALPSKARPAE